jgi:NAD(P)-dependent dehydrogenase (short-subunit alcohol dehydrogenase family)
VSARRALVTGAARGIGAEIAERLRAEGFEVVTADRDPGCELTFDVASDPLPELGNVDVCVSNAAITDTIAPAHELTSEQWERDLAVNLTGAFRVIQACLPGMRERRYGRIVVISSSAAAVGLPGQVAYAASKSGLLGMAKTIAAENVRRGITVNCVLPGLIASERVAAMPQALYDRLESTFMPSGRIGEMHEVASLVAYLASEDSGYVTGQEIGVDGGAWLNTFSLTRQQRD